MHTNKKITLGALSVLAILASASVDGWQMIWTLHVAAQGAVVPTENIFSQTANLAVTISMAMQTLAFVIFHFLQFFLDPLFIMDINGTEGLRNIWKYSRDIMNVIFAFMLIFAGIFTVVTGNKELVQQKYKRFILAVILVNFSWFFPRVILDVANVLTATVYQIPAGLNAGGEIDCKLPLAADDAAGGAPPAEEKTCKMVNDMAFFKDCNSDKTKDYTQLIPGIICAEMVEWKKDTNTSYGMLNGLVINYAQLPELTRVLNPSSGTGGPADGDERFQEYLLFLMHVIFVLVLMLMIFLPLAAMFVVFLIRIPIMWFTIAFMPFMFLGFVMGDKMGQFDTMKIFQHYVKAAFLPTVVAIPFAVGFMILTEFTQVDCKTASIAPELCKTTGPFLFNVNTPWQLLILLITFFVIWSGFWMALKIDDIYVNATSGIKSLGDTLGKTAVKLPLSIPFIPTGEGKPPTSILGLDDKLRSFSANLSAGKDPLTSAGLGKEGAATSSRDEKIVSALTESGSPINQALNKIANGAGSRVELRTAIDAQLKAEGDNDLKRALKDAGVDDPSTVSTDDILRRIDDTTDSTLLQHLERMREEGENGDT